MHNLPASNSQVSYSIVMHHDAWLWKTSYKKLTSGPAQEILNHLFNDAWLLVFVRYSEKFSISQGNKLPLCFIVPLVWHRSSSRWHLPLSLIFLTVTVTTWSYWTSCTFSPKWFSQADALSALPTQWVPLIFEVEAKAPGSAEMFDWNWMLRIAVT